MAAWVTRLTAADFLIIAAIVLALFLIFRR
jgi:hypothetical protein